MALRDQNSGKEKASADLLRRTLASSPGTAEACPDPEILAAYADRALDAAETARYELHFSQCAHCRDQLAAISRAAVPAETPPTPRLSWIWTWGGIALAPVTAMLLIAAILIAHHPASNRGAEQQPLVAMQTPSQPPAAAATPEPELTPTQPVREPHPTAPAKPAVPFEGSRTRSEAGSIQRVSPPNFTSDLNSKNDEAKVSPAPADKELDRDLVSNARNMVQLEKSAKQSAPASPKAASGDVALSAQSQAVTVESSVEPTPTAPPAPAQLASGAAAGAMSGGNAAALRAAAPAKKAPAVTMNSTNFAASETVSIDSAADRDALTIVRSSDPQVLWRISAGRYVERSGDAGATWRTQWTSANARVVAGSAPSADTCWLVGQGGIVLVTKDGKKWRMVEPPVTDDFVEVAATDASSATITATDGRRFETRDGGKHWSPAP